jgi:hypothetical protein
MTLSHGLALGVLAAVMVLLLWGRLRHDIVAAPGLAAGIAVGVVPAERAFSGFSDDIVIIVASALVVSAAIARSGALEAGLQMLAPWQRPARRPCGLHPGRGDGRHRLRRRACHGGLRRRGARRWC